MALAGGARQAGPSKFRRRSELINHSRATVPAKVSWYRRWGSTEPSPRSSWRGHL